MLLLQKLSNLKGEIWNAEQPSYHCPFCAPSPQYQYKKNYEKSKGHYHTIPDNLEQLHLKEATELQSIVSGTGLISLP